MVLLKKLFGTRNRNTNWQQGNEEQRRQYLESLNNEQAILDFMQVETTELLRQVAADKVNSESALDSLCSDSQADVRQSARARLLTKLLPETAALSSISDTAILTRIASLTDDNELRLQAIGQISDQEALYSIAREHSVARVRAVAAEGIADEARLQALQSFAQGKDKTLYRLCKDKLSTIRQNKEQAAAREEAVLQLTAQLRYLLKIGYHPEFHGKLLVIRQQWSELESSASPAQAAEVRDELNNAQQLLDNHAEAEKALREKEALAEKARNEQQQIVITLETALASEDEALTLDTIIHQAEQSWHDNFALHTPEKSVSQRFEKALQSLLTLNNARLHWAETEADISAFMAEKISADPAELKSQQQAARQWLKAINWPSDVNPPALLTALQQRLQQIQDAQKAHDADINAVLETLNKDLTALEKAIDDGSLREANSHVKHILNGLKKAGHNAQAQQKRFRALDTRLREIKDWAGFAVTPKRQALTEQMESLIGADMPAELLAEKIHSLQEQWKELAGSSGDNELWQQFRNAADRAFEPCKEHFAEATRLREQNTALRQRLINELESYETAMDWSNADWKTVQKTLNTARESFRQYSPVDRPAHKQTQAQFRDVCDRIYSHLQAEYDRNLALKKDIVDLAEQLSQSEDLSQAADQVKTFQAQWKAIGITPRGPDQKLWQAFRKHCDAIFQQLNAKRDARKAEFDSVIAQAEALVSRANALLTDTPDNAGQLLKDIRAEFSALTLPKSAHQRLIRSLNSVADALEEQKSAAKRQAAEQRWNNLLAILNGEPADQADLPAGYQASELVSANNNNEAALELCIQMEILADTPSPDEDKSARMNIQVQRLAQGLGQQLSTDDERRTLIIRWQKDCSGHPLTARFASAIRASL